MNNGISESDFDEWIGCDKTPQFTIHVTELGKNQILNNQAIVEGIKKLQSKAMGCRDIVTASICKELLETTFHSECPRGKKL